MPFRVLILGGYGQFGQRIVRMLAADPAFETIVAGRHLQKAQQLCDALHDAGAVQGRLVPLRLDLHARLEAALSDLRPHLVIHTAGPFQTRDYTVAAQTLRAGAHYIDLADARVYVAGFNTALAALAQTHGRWAITGASSVPGLSAAVATHHASRFAALQSLESGITPGNRIERGLATTRAVLGYVGQPIRILRQGRWTQVHGWQSLRRVDVPGVGPRWFARCDVPDLDILPARHLGLNSCDFRAGLELRRMHFGLWLASWAVRCGLVRDLPAYASRLLALGERWRHLGTDVGAMHVDMAGIDHAGQPLVLRWSIVARDGQGPRIPATPAVVLARKLAQGTLPTPDARACVDLFALDECLAALDDPCFTTRLDVLPLA